MEKILPKPEPRFIMLVLLSGMQMVGEINPEGPDWSNPNVFADMPPHQPVLIRRPCLMAMQPTETPGRVKPILQLAVSLPHADADQPKPILRSQIMFCVAPTDAGLHKLYTRTVSGGLDIVSSLGAVGANLR